MFAGFGVEQLRDNNFETYWQSDGHLPHLVNIQFKVKLPHLILFFVRSVKFFMKQLFYTRLCDEVQLKRFS